MFRFDYAKLLRPEIFRKHRSLALASEDGTFEAHDAKTLEH